MDRHFLIAVSDQKSAIFGVRFVSDFFSDKGNVKSTLFYSTPKPPAIFENERSLEATSRQNAQEQKNIAQGKEAVEKARQVCLECGFKPENLIDRVETQVFSKVADIIQEGERGLYDAVVLGRRGLSMLEEAFEDSVSRDIFDQTFTFPLWLCRSSDPVRKNVLFYGDGSGASFQMADHVGFITGLEKRHRVDILMPESTTDQSSTMDQYKQILLKHGLTADMIQTRSLGANDPAKQILNLVNAEAYAAVALGRSDNESNLLARLFKGPVSSTLFRELKNAALWFCP
ncbi:MAG: universal stress protein [Proteobacteria bacterium]|nr:universal stress protein [Desulfobacula sp.]MBU3950728.1 universal stress protein [Pseudomonadota bacterium]MBU4129596.1 universal stress protein [Pseudomonadota bacterium]